MGIRDKPTAPASPWQNGFAERLIGSIRRECVDHIIVLGEVHLRQILQSYARYYNDIRTHRSLNKDAPVSRQNSANRKHQITRHPWRTSPPLRPSLSFRYTQGLLNGRRATTHWQRARELQVRFPKVKVEEDRIFIIDGPVWTSAGMTAGIDLALAMIEQDLGADVARAVARQLVVYHRRAGGQSQFSALLELEPKSDRIQSALAYAKRNLTSKLTVKQLANAAHLSPRQFSRAFRAETGQSPAKAVENLRVETARLMMEQSRHSIDVIARQTGFADRYRMRRAFLRAFGQPPQVIRRNAHAELAA